MLKYMNFISLYISYLSRVNAGGDTRKPLQISTTFPSYNLHKKNHFVKFI